MLDLFDAQRRERVASQVWAVDREFRLLVAACSLMVLLIVVEPWFGLLSPVRFVAGFAFAFFIPGYAICTALFPARNDLDGIARAGVSIGLSIAWTPVLALILDGLPWGLQLWSIAIGQAVTVLAFSQIGAWRRARLIGELAYTPGVAWRPRRWWKSLQRPARVAYAVTMAALLVVGLSIGWIFLGSGADTEPTEFYMLGAGGLAEDYPREARIGDPLDLTIGIANTSGSNRTFRVEVWVQDTWSPERRAQIKALEPFTVAGEGTVELPVHWTMPWSGDDQQVDIFLFMDDDGTPHRSLRLFLDVAD